MKLQTLLLFSVSVLIGCNSGSQKEAESHDHSHESPSHTHEVVSPEVILEKTVIALSDISPEYIQLANNIEIIPDVTSEEKTVGVLTHEGDFGPLLFGEKIWSFFIVLKPGMFLAEHPHATESIVYTISGKWVLCSEGKRHVMEAGSSFHFGSNMPTGWEAPFGEDAFLLVVKSKPDGLNYRTDMESLTQMKNDLDIERKNGTPFYFNELKSDHPAILFARSVNPGFDEVLALKY